MALCCDIDTHLPATIENGSNAHAMCWCNTRTTPDRAQQEVAQVRTVSFLVNKYRTSVFIGVPCFHYSLDRWGTQPSSDHHQHNPCAQTFTWKSSTHPSTSRPALSTLEIAPHEQYMSSFCFHEQLYVIHDIIHSYLFDFS